MWDEITYPFPILNGATVEVWQWISNFLPRFITDVIFLSMQELKLIHIDVSKRGSSNFLPYFMELHLLYAKSMTHNYTHVKYFYTNKHQYMFIQVLLYKITITSIYNATIYCKTIQIKIMYIHYIVVTAFWATYHPHIPEISHHHSITLLATNS